MANYYMDENGNISRKRKSKGNAYYMDENGKISLIKDEEEEEEIAPVKTTANNTVTENKKDDGGLEFFQAPSVFDNGVNVGSVTKSILGTVGDAGVNVAKGAAGLVEGVTDLALYGASAIAKKTESGDLEFEAQYKAERLLDTMLSESDYNAYAKRLGIKTSYADYKKDLEAQAKEIIDSAKNGGIAQHIKSVAQKDSVNDAMKGADNFLDNYSVLGKTSDAVFQGVGQVGAILATGGMAGAAGLGSAGATAATTALTGVSGMGSGMSEAYKGGATDSEALAYGAIAGAADALTELLFGGLGKSVKAVGLSSGVTSLDDIVAKKVSGVFKNQITKNLTEFGIKSSFEGFEEVIAGLTQAIGKKITYMSEEELGKIIEDENLLEQLVVGVLTSGIAQSGIVPGMKNGSLIEANKTGRDFITGNTQNEQAVIDAEVNDRITEAEKGGKKLKGRDKNKIIEQVKSDLEKGYISTDTIERVLGGTSYNEFKNGVDGFMGSDTYKAYNDAIAEEKSLREEFEELQKVKITDADLGQQSRFNEVKSRLEEIKKEAKTTTLRKELDAEIERINGLKDRLRQEVSERVKGERLSESYRELQRSTEKFQADPAQYDNEYARKTVQNIVDSGIANNTNETREFVDFMAKISADKGVVFSLTDAERLAGTRYAKDGATTNAYVTDGGDIVINADSKKRLNSLVGHEVTHVLEGTELYGKLQEAVFAYAQKKGDYDSRLKAITELYQKHDPKADPKKELTADLVGDYLFTDRDFINNLSTEHRNVFQKIYDEIKYLVKIATGSKEARALEKAKKMFEAAYRENVKTQKNTADGGVITYSLSQYTEHQKENWKSSKRIVVYDSNEQLSQFIQDSIADKTMDKKMYFGAVSTDLASKIQSETGLNVENYNLSLGAYEIRKILKDHGNETTEALRGQRAITADDFSHIVDVVLSPTSIKLSDKPYMGKPAIIFSGNYNGKMNVVAVVSDKRLDLFVQTIYANTKKENLSTPTGEQAPINTPEANNGTVFSNNSISQNSEKSIGEAKKSTGDADVRFSLSDNSDEKQIESYAEIMQKQMELNRRENALRERKQEATNNPELLQAMDNYSSLFDEMRELLPKRRLGTATQAELDRIEEIKAQRDEYESRIIELQESLGLSAISKEETEIREMRETLRVAADEAWEREGAEKENQAIRKAGISAEEYFRKKALKAFKTTTNFNEAGYLLPDGKLLNFSGGERNHRYRDHREIGEIYEATNGTAALNRFLNDGNIRIMAESPGIDIASSVNPTQEQYAAIRKLINSNGLKEGRFYVDFSDAEGRRAGNYAYEGRVNADRIINDIKYFYQNGETRETSSVADFFSLSASDTDPARRGGGYAVYGDNIRVRDKSEFDFAPLPPMQETAQETATVTDTEDYPIMEAPAPMTEEEANSYDGLEGITDADAPPVMDAPYYGENEDAVPTDPFEDRDIKDVGNRKVKAYMYENPEVKPFFQEEANIMLGELQRTTKGERFYNMDVYYETNGQDGITGTSRNTSQDIAYLLDELKYSYKQIETGLKAIIEDNGKENNAVSKRIEFLLNDRLMNGYQDFEYGLDIPPNQDYVNLLNEKQIQEYNDEARQKFFETADNFAPMVEAPMRATSPTLTERVDDIAPVKGRGYEAVTPKKGENRLTRKDVGTPEEQQIARVLDEDPKPENREKRAWARFVANVFDKGAVFEKVALKNKNRELIGKWNYMLYSEARAQNLIGNGTDYVKSLYAIEEEVGATGKTQEFYEYLYHKHNVDRMNLADRYEDKENLPVFGYSVTSEMSEAKAQQLEAANPEFARYAQDIYDYNNHLRQLLVDNGVISQETADAWAEMYPHYVPIRRAGDKGIDINVPLDTGRTSVNAPVKRATGGNSDILPLFDTMAQRTLQTYKAIAKNSFGVELKNTLGTTIETGKIDVDDVIDTIDAQDGLLQEGKNGRSPTFTVFENGEKVTYEITKDMYDALKPVSEGLAYTNKLFNTASNFHRGLLTEYNPVFMLTNALKDVQDVLINSQHSARTYAKMPEAFGQLLSKGYWYKEYMANGGEQNSYFDNETGTFKTENKGIKKLLDFPPLRAISTLNNFIEMIPRLAEYIASREAGRSVEVSMLDAARVTTNFRAGGDITKFLNRNGATFLNASVQGVMQQVRNVREAKANGLKGWVALAAKFAAAGLPALLLNGLLWDDDDEYEELSDYVKQNYYIVAKTDDSKFIRIPKGRTLAVIQNAFEQVSNAITGDDEVDLKSFVELVVSNLAPNNPVDDNIAAPIIQVLNNKTWYGEDLVPTRLQDLPAAEQFDESTDTFSKWLGQIINYSPVKINYLLDQYSGGLGDTILPMLTPEAESGDNSFWGNVFAPLKSKFTTDSAMNNQNVSDFYDKKDELTTNAKASGATDEDILKNKYMNSVNSEIADLYAQKREIQNSSLSDKEKYEQVRAIQNQIVNLTRESLDAYEGVNINGEYATVGDRYFKLDDEGEWRKMTDDQVTKYLITSEAEARGESYGTNGKVHYRLTNKGEWVKISDKQLERQKEVTKALGISPSEYWAKTDIMTVPMAQGEYEMAYDSPEKYDYLNNQGISYDEYASADDNTKAAHSWAANYPEKYTVSKAVTNDVVKYKTYTKALSELESDKDANGKAISGSRKEKVLNYINGLNINYGEKLVLFKSEYPADDTYNNEIIDYLNSRSDLTYEEIVTILTELDFKVDDNGNISW